MFSSNRYHFAKTALSDTIWFLSCGLTRAQSDQTCKILFNISVRFFNRNLSIVGNCRRYIIAYHELYLQSHTWSSLGPIWSNLGSIWAQFGPKLTFLILTYHLSLVFTLKHCGRFKKCIILNQSLCLLAQIWPKVGANWPKSDL